MSLQMIYNQVLSIQIGDKMFGIPIDKIQDVLKEQPLTSVPLSESFIKGVMNLRGRIVTVVDLPDYLGMTQQEADSYMNVVIEHHNELFSFTVDKVHDVMPLHEEAVKDLPVTLDPLWRSVSHCIYPMDESLMVVLNPAAIIATFSNMQVNEALSV